LTVHISCEVEPRRIEDVLPGEARGRGPLDFREPGMKVESRSVFSGDLRKQYVRDNVTTVEWPLGEAVTTRSVTRGVWQASACPADLPPDLLERWLLIPRGTGGSEPRPEDLPELQIDRDLAPKMLKGLWSSTVRTRVDGGTEETHPEEIGDAQCVASWEPLRGIGRGHGQQDTERVPDPHALRSPRGSLDDS
jgi:hypothetical protein